MEWSEAFGPECKPDTEQIQAFVENPLWTKLLEFIRAQYGLGPKLEYSRCGMAPGWNLKFKKSGRNLCTLYPRRGYFDCMIVIGEAQQCEAERILPACSQAMQTLYHSTGLLNGSRWLYFAVREPSALEDAKRLLAARMKPGLQ